MIGPAVVCLAARNLRWFVHGSPVHRGLSLVISETSERAETALESLWRQYAPELTRFAAVLSDPHDAHDLVSTAFARLAHRDLSQIANQRAYLYRTVANAAYDERRSRDRRRRREEAVRRQASIEHVPADPDVHRALLALSPQQRAVVYLSYWDDLDSPQIAALMGIRPATVRRHLARARTHLRKALQ